MGGTRAEGGVESVHTDSVGAEDYSCCGLLPAPIYVNESFTGRGSTHRHSGRLEPTALVPGTATIFLFSVEKERGEQRAALVEEFSAGLRACR